MMAINTSAERAILAEALKLAGIRQVTFNMWKQQDRDLIKGALEVYRQRLELQIKANNAQLRSKLLNLFFQKRLRDTMKIIQSI